MKLEAPPSRYRVIERGGRLVVVDSKSGATPLKAKDLLPDSMPQENSYPRESGDPEPQAASLLTLDSRFRGNTDDGNEKTLEAPAPSMPSYVASRSPVAQPPGLLRNVASTVCSDKRDRDGRLQWTTARWFDARGPRTITLVKRTEEQLGLATLALLIGAFVAVILAVAIGFVGWVILVIAASSLPKAKPAVTKWVDRLALR